MRSSCCGAKSRSEPRRTSGSSRRRSGNARPARDAVADQMVGLGRSRRQPVAVGQAHQPRRLARGHQPGRVSSPVDDDQELAARAAGRRAQAAGEAVEARLAPARGAAGASGGCGGRARRRCVRRAPGPASTSRARRATARRAGVGLLGVMPRLRSPRSSRQSTSRVRARRRGQRHQSQSRRERRRKRGGGAPQSAEA